MSEENRLGLHPNLPILNKSYVSGQFERNRFPIYGDALEGFEIWLPDLIPVVDSSLVEMYCQLRLDGTIIQPEYSVARFRRRAFI